MMGWNRTEKLSTTPSRTSSRASSPSRVAARRNSPTRPAGVSSRLVARPMGKARAVAALADQWHLDLTQCWAYGDSAKDREMLEAVGKPAAVNPTWKLARMALKRDWPVWRWREKEICHRDAESTE